MQRFFDAQKDWTGTYDKEIIKRRKEFLQRCRPQRQTLLGVMLRYVRDQREEWTKHYLGNLAGRLEPEAMVGITPNLRQLLKLAEHKGDMPLDIRRRHEAIRFFDEARAVMQLEYNDPIDHVSADLVAMLKLLEARFFETGSSDVIIWTGHDRDDHYRVKECSMGQSLEHDGLFIKSEAVPCRIYLGSRGPVFVALHQRIKKHYKTLLKMVRQWRKAQVGQWRENHDPFTVPDRCGMKLVVPNEEVAFAAQERIGTIIEDVGGIVLKQKNRLTEDSDCGNEHSSRHFKALSLLILWRKRHFEIQITTFQHHYSSEFATGKENHIIYELLQCFDYYFPWLFPNEIYGVDWTDERLRQDIMAFQLMRLGWRIDRRTLPVRQNQNEN